MERPSRQHTPGDNSHYQYLNRLVEQIDLLTAKVNALESKLGLTSPGSRSSGISDRVGSSGVNIPAATDANATAQVYAAGLFTGVPSSGTMSAQNASSVAITGGSITGITDLAVADGGTGASNAATARTNLDVPQRVTTVAGTYAPPTSITVNAEGMITAIA